MVDLKLISESDISKLLSNKIDKMIFSLENNYTFYGKVIAVDLTMIKAYLPHARLGDICEIGGQKIGAEIVNIDKDIVSLSPFSSVLGIRCGDLVLSLQKSHKIKLGQFLLGSVVDGLGNMMDLSSEPLHVDEERTIESQSPNPLQRETITKILPVGIKSIDGLLTCGEGQRIGIFAAAGGGKSTLLNMISSGIEADIIVLTLVGERGREVKEFLEYHLDEQTRKRTVVVVSTSDKPAIERYKAAFTATCIAEYFRDKGQKVVLMVDSLTRFARASREIATASGEPLSNSGFPASMFAKLPQLLERVGNNSKGSITAFYTVLVEGDNMKEPVADEVRSILDGHIVLSRKLAEANHYPAIDILASVSRIMNQITDSEHLSLAAKIRRLLSKYSEVELLVKVGEYKKGNDSLADEAIEKYESIISFLCQTTKSHYHFEDIITNLKEIIT